MSLSKFLEDARSGLIDLTFRNPLLNYKPLRSRGFEFSQSNSTEVLSKLFTLNADQDTFIHLELEKVISNFSDVQIISRLRKTHADSRLHLEEKGVNVLFLAGFFVTWQEDARSDQKNRSPLLLVPIRIQIEDERSISLIRLDEDVQENYALLEKIKVAGSDFPLFENYNFDLHAYAKAVTEFTQRREGWHLDLETLSVDIFKTQKYFIYEDLNSKNWDLNVNSIDEMPDLIKQLSNKNIFTNERDDDDPRELDRLEFDDEPLLIKDADLTQLQAILYARKNKSFLIQGPPGTGKSQTITNLIADLIAQNKTVLFVSEKSTALEVVKKNLAKSGLISVVLDLHSSDSKKTTILQEIGTTIDGSIGFNRQTRFSPETYSNVKNKIFDYRAALSTPINETDIKAEHVFTELGDINHILKSKLISPSLFDSLRMQSDFNIKNLTHKSYEENRKLLRTFQKIQVTFTKDELGILLKSNFKKNKIFDEIAISRIAYDVQSIISENPDLSVLDLEIASQEIHEIISQIENQIGREFINKVFSLQLWDNEWILNLTNIDILHKKIKSLLKYKKEYQKQIKEKAWATENLVLREIVSNNRQGFLSRIFSAKKSSQLLSDYFFTPLSQEKIHGYLNVHAKFFKLIDEMKLVALKIKNAKLESIVFRLPLEELDKELDDIHSIFEARDKIKLLLQQLREFDVITVQDAWVTYKKTEATNSPSAKLAVLKDQLVHLIGDNSISTYSPNELNFFCSTLLKLIPHIDTGYELIDLYEQIKTKQLLFVFNGCIDDYELTFRYICMSMLQDLLYVESPILEEISGSDLEKLRYQFAELDIEKKDYVKEKILQKQRENCTALLESPTDGFKVLKREIHKKRNVLTIRKVLSLCFEEIKSIKPVFMMSPLTVASFVKRNPNSFDIVIFDEASQIKPSEAIGAILRGKNSIVVGDRMQLPPSNMFDVDSTNDDDYLEVLDNDQIANDKISDTIKNHESILDLCSSVNTHEKKLSWHYRSKFNSLIAVSNKEFYENRLVTFPDISVPKQNEGLEFKFISNGNYERSGSRKNTNEAKDVVNSVIEHITNRPEKSLGVATFSLAQKQAIDELISHDSMTRSLISDFNKRHADEPFFIKNLETIQGDERDSIYISVGYGKAMDSPSAPISFGPLTQLNGDRRLNVLISRSKYQCKVFSSIHFSDINTDGIQNKGTIKLKTFLKYAETGEIDLPQITGGDYDSEFEKSVADSIRNLGYTVDNQIGSAGFKIDLAVKSPDNLGTYLCGIECDGATYHSSLSAREKDRIRQEILESKGWNIIRVWSTDWFRNKNTEVMKLEKKITDLRSRRHVV